MLLHLTFNGACQKALETKSGQKILLYSDGSWEYNEDVKQQVISPFEKPNIADQSNESEKEKLIAYLQKEEVRRLIKSEQAKSEGDKQLQNDKLITVSNDLIMLLSLKQGSKEEKSLLKILNKKYIPVEEGSRGPVYKSPLSTGKSITSLNDCILTNEIESESGLASIKTQKTKLLTYTPKKLLNYYKDKTYLTIESAIVKKDGDTFIEFDLIFNSKDIKKGYGYIPKDGFVRINMIKGPGIFLEITKPTEAQIETYTGRTIYPLVCRIKTKDDLRRLNRQYLDDIGIMWSTGFEAYPIYDIAYFKEKFKCINGKK